MYLSNTTFAFLNTNNSIFQNHNLSAVNSGIFAPTEKPQTALQKLSNQIATKQANSERLEDLAQSAQIRKDTFVKTNEAAPLEERLTGVLELYLGIARLYLTVAEGREQEISDFKEQLQEWDQTIQGYQDILDGKAALPEEHTMQSILWSYQIAQRDREQLLQDGIAHINGYQYGESFSNESADYNLKAILGENKFAEKDPSAWLIDPTASDIYAEIDRVFSEVHGVVEEFRQGVEDIYSLLKERGYGEKYKIYLKPWVDPQNSYFDRTEEINMIERLMKEPLIKL